MRAAAGGGALSEQRDWKNGDDENDAEQCEAVGVGISLAAGFLVARDLEQGRLVRLLPQYRPVEFSMNAVYPHRHHLSAKVRSFIDLLVHHSVEHQHLIDPFS
jgi:DNA-binding transcriptional LysR family regulator